MVTEAFGLLAEAWAGVRGGAEGLLTVSTLLTFASNWLARHLGSFPDRASKACRAPRHLEPSRRFRPRGIDIAIRSGGGNLARR